jgi:hypothetical protein
LLLYTKELYNGGERGAGELKISPLETQINHKEKTVSLFGNDRHANYGKTKQNKTKQF